MSTLFEPNDILAIYGQRYRLVRLDRQDAFVIALDSHFCLPSRMSLQSLAELLALGNLRVTAGAAPAPRMCPPTEVELRCAVRRWLYIERIVEHPRLFDNTVRSHLVQLAAREFSVTRQTVIRCLRLYLQGGASRDALLPTYTHSERDDSATARSPNTSR